MAAKFSDMERAEIAQRLVDEGEAAFARVGLKHANVEALATAAGISKGAFYSFFDSKEALYLAVLAAQIEGVEARVLAPLIDADLAPRRAFEAFLRALMAEYSGNPVLRRLIEHPDELERVRRKAGGARAAAKQAFGFAPLADFFARAEAEGRGGRAPADVLVGAVVLLPHLLLHRDEPGVGDWAPLEAFLIQAVADAAFGPEPASIRERDHGSV